MYSALVCGAFCVASSFCVLYNKHILSHVFANANCLLLVQNVVAVLLLGLGRRTGKLSFEVSLTTRGDWLSAGCYTVNVMAGLAALGFMSVPMFSALKRSTIAVSWVIEWLFDYKPTTMGTLPALGVMLGSTLFAAHHDLKFEWRGYALAVTSCVAQGSAFELGRRIAQSSNKGICAVLFANSVVSMLVQLAFLGVTGEWRELLPALTNPEVVVHFVGNSLAALALNYCVFLNCTVNSPLAHAVTGNMKAVFTTTIGAALFESHLALLGWLGVRGNFTGAGWFTAIKLRHQTEAKRRQQRAAQQPV